MSSSNGSGAFSSGRPRSSSTYTTSGGYLSAPMARNNSVVSNKSNFSAYTDGSLENEACYSPATAFSSAPSPGGYMDSNPRTTSFSIPSSHSPGLYQDESTVSYQYDLSGANPTYKDKTQRNLSSFNDSSKSRKRDLPRDDLDFSYEDEDLEDVLANTPFDPRMGDPKIHPQMYYDFIVTKNEVYWQLKPGYQPSEEYPETRPDTIMIDELTGKRVFPCRRPECTSSKPFGRCWDLRRHFVIHDQRDSTKKSSRSSSSSNKVATSSKSKHSKSKEKGLDDEGSIHCDYRVCPSNRHINPFNRKDHCREHYREVHNEDLIKRSSQDGKTLMMWLKNKQILKDWWRCGKCLKRISIGKYGWTCSKCGAACEEERRANREDTFGPWEETQTRGSSRHKSSSSTRRRSSQYKGSAESSQRYVEVGLGRSSRTQGIPQAYLPRQDYSSNASGEAECEYDEDYEYDSRYPTHIGELPETRSAYVPAATSWGRYDSVSVAPSLTLETFDYGGAEYAVSNDGSALYSGGAGYSNSNDGSALYSGGSGQHYTPQYSYPHDPYA